MQGKQLQFEGLEDEVIPIDVYTRRFERESLKGTAEHMTKGHWEDVMLIPNYRESGKWVVVFRPHLEEYIQRVNLYMDRCEATILAVTSDS